MNDDQATDVERDEDGLPWRSIGTLAAVWAVRFEAQRFEHDLLEEADYVPIAWAAE